MAVIEWWQQGRATFKTKSRRNDEESHLESDPSGADSNGVTLPPLSSSKARLPPPIGPGMPVPCILASDPVRHNGMLFVLTPGNLTFLFTQCQYTAQAFHTRTSLYAHPLSFRDITEGKLPEIASKPVGIAKSNMSTQSSTSELSSLNNTASSSTSDDSWVIEMVVCSFALHLIEKPSELFALLWELRCVESAARVFRGHNCQCVVWSSDAIDIISLKARWLVVLAPHKRPEVRRHHAE